MTRDRIATLGLVVALGACAAPRSDTVAPAPRTASAPGPSPRAVPEGPLPHHRASSRGDYAPRRAVFETKLTRDGPLLEHPAEVTLPPGAQRITFESDGVTLWGWYAAPPGAKADAPVPVLVYLHGGFGLQTDHFERVRPFLDSGIAVLLPTLRGRNGNGGRHELLLGEVDDARAAAAWAGARPEVDARGVYVFGHSLGGGAAALLALDRRAPVRLTAGCGALYSTETFGRWQTGHDANLVRFDPHDVEEAEMRLLLPHVEQLVHPHYAYMGVQERVTQANAKAAASRAIRAMAPLYIDIVPGDHMSALHPALTKFREVVLEDALRALNDEPPAPPLR